MTFVGNSILQMHCAFIESDKRFISHGEMCFSRKVVHLNFNMLQKIFYKDIYIMPIFAIESSCLYNIKILLCSGIVERKAVLSEVN